MKTFLLNFYMNWFCLDDDDNGSMVKHGTSTDYNVKTALEIT